jgi:hypothetical protein
MARPRASAEAVLSPAEAIDSIRTLSAPDLLRLKKASQYWSYGGARPPEDLRHEAIRRVAAGARKCPRDIPIVAFLIGVMRSIASADRKALQRTPTLALVPRHDSAATSLLDGADPRLSPEERLIQAEEKAEIRGRILALFEDDVVAQTLADLGRNGGQRTPRTC